MVKTALVAMTLLGCDCDAKVCQFVSETPQQFASVAECEAAMQTHVLRNSTLDYPLITGQCRVTGEPGVELAEQATPAGDLPAANPSAAHVGESPSHVFQRTAHSYRIVTSGVGRAADFVFDTASAAANRVTPALARVASLLPGD